MNRQEIEIKKDILKRIIEAFYSDDFEENVRLIPYDMRPQGYEATFRCCVHKERAIIKDRIIAGLGFKIEEDDERVNVSTYAKRANERTQIDESNLTVLQDACKGCVPSQVYVTDLCQGCVARPCQKACNFDAIQVGVGRAKIDSSKCKKCGMCMSACPYNAIVKITVPCEEACPVRAIEKGEYGLASIDFDKCISCGKCIAACPFGAVHEKSQIIDILKAMKSDEIVIAMFAPAIAGQFDGNIYQLRTALLQAGFDEVREVAQGADVTTENEAKEFLEKMEKGQKFMTTSCCAGYNQLRKKHLKEINEFASSVQTPLYYTAELIKKEYPDAITVFISPCVAKRAEVFENENINYIMSCEELEALFAAKKIKVSECEETECTDHPSKQARNYGVTGGVAEAVKKKLPDESLVKSCVINGLNKETIKQLKKYASNGYCDNECNLVEVMACEGGCIGGNSNINDKKNAKNLIDKLLEQSSDEEKL